MNNTEAKKRETWHSKEWKEVFFKESIILRETNKEKINREKYIKKDKYKWREKERKKYKEEEEKEKIRRI